MGNMATCGIGKLSGKAGVFPNLDEPEPYEQKSDTRNPAHLAREFIEKKLLGLR